MHCVISKKKHDMNIHCYEFIISLQKPYVSLLIQAHLLSLHALHRHYLFHMRSCPTNEYVDWMSQMQTEL